MPNLSTSGGAGWPLIALGAMLWGTDLLLRPTLLQHPGFSAVRIVLYEHLALAAVFLPLLAARRLEWRFMSRREGVCLLYIAWAGSAAATVLLTLAYQLGDPQSGALTATLLQKTQPLFAVALAGVVLRERRQPVFWVIFACSIAATYLLSFGFIPPLTALKSPRAASVACALGAALLWGSCTVAGRSALQAMRPSLVAAWRFMLALPLLIVLNLVQLSRSGIENVPPAFDYSSLLLLAGIVILPDILGMTLYYIGLRSTPASQATIAELAYPVSAMVLGASLLHQHLGAGQWIGIALLALLLPVLQSTRSVIAPAQTDPGSSLPTSSSAAQVGVTG